MKHPHQPTLEQKLLNSRPADMPANAAFVDRTLKAVKKASSRETFAAQLRTTSTTKQENWFMKFKHLPKLAMVALGIAGLAALSGTAYAAYRWLEPKVNITNITDKNDDNRKQYTIDQQCGSELQRRQFKYELARSATLTDDDVYKVFKNTCDFIAIQSFIAKTWVPDNDRQSVDRKQPGDTVTIYEHSNMYAGGDSQNFGLTFGTVQDITPTSITLALKLYHVEKLDGTEALPEGRTVSRTLSLSSDTSEWENGQQLPKGTVKVGDTVQLVQKNVHKLDQGKHLTAPERSIAAIVKAAVDPAYLWGESSGNPAITDQIAGLAECHNNAAYLCAAPLNQQRAEVYSTVDRFAENKKHLRTDLPVSSPENMHQIQGRITAIDGTHITLRARGTSDTVKLTLPYDAVAQYNRVKTPKVAIGDLAEVYYLQKPGSSSLVLEARDISMFLLLQHRLGDDTVVNY